MHTNALVDDTLAALADPVRRHVVELRAERPMRPGELAQEVGASPSSLSKHLRVLRERGLVVESHPESDARVRISTLESAPMVELRSLPMPDAVGRRSCGIRRVCRASAVTTGSSDASRVVVALRVRVGVDRVFAAFTEDIVQWRQPHGLFHSPRTCHPEHGGHHSL